MDEQGFPQVAIAVQPALATTDPENEETRHLQRLLRWAVLGSNQ
jgi:hypothetical protein